MQDSWPQMKSDIISWRKTLKISHNSQNQSPVVSTLCQEMKVYLKPKGWIRMNIKIRPPLEVTTCCLQDKYGVAIRIESMNKDHSHSWVKTSQDLKMLVTNLNDNEQETSEMQFEDNSLKSNARAFASRSKTKAKTQRRTSAISSTKPISIGERTWTDIEPRNYSLTNYSVSKNWRKDDWILEKKRSSAEPFRTQFYWSFITRQCLESGGCTMILHSIINAGFIPGG